MEKTDNELIAAFDGWENFDDRYFINKINKNRRLPMLLIEMPYLKSYDWLMPVVEKINSGAIDEYTCIHIDQDTVFAHLNGKNGDPDNSWMHEFEINGNLKAAIYQAVVACLRFKEEMDESTSTDKTNT